MSEEQDLDRFEAGMAILMGLAAIGSAWAGFQSGLWGGNQAAAYGEAATIATQASTAQTEAFVDISSDFSIDIQAKRLINEGKDAANPTDKRRAFELASYLYRYQLSEAGYEGLGLPPQYREDMAGAAARAAVPTAPAPAADADPDEDADDAEATDDEAGAAPDADESIPAALLIASLDKDLDDDTGYYSEMQEEGIALQAKSRERFAAGQTSNLHGDKYDFAGVLYTISLFFAGITSVFKSDVRKKIFAVSAGIFVLTTLFVLSLPWAELPF